MAFVVTFLRTYGELVATAWRDGSGHDDNRDKNKHVATVMGKKNKDDAGSPTKSRITMTTGAVEASRCGDGL